MSTATELPFPSELLSKLPEPQSGHRWAHRTTGWKSERECLAATGNGEWAQQPKSFGLCDHYAELVAIEEPDYASRDYQKSVLDAAWEGVPCEFRRSIEYDWVNEAAHRDVAQSVHLGYQVRIKPAPVDPPKPDPYAELKAAHARGEAIQVRSYLDDQWEDIKSPSWNAFDGPSDYRVKPKPEMVPLEAGDWFPLGWMVRYTKLPTTNKDLLLNCSAVLGISDNCIAVHAQGKMIFTYEEAAELLERTRDGINFEPCHKPAK